MISIRADVTDYTNRVLGVIKEKYGLKDKSEALNRFAEMFGDKFVNKSDLTIPFDKKEIMILQDEANKYKASNKKRKMSMDELDDILGL